MKPRLSFDERTIRIQPSWTDTRLYFLHGALHLVVLGDGTTCKRQATAFQTILDQFGRPFLRDHTARPLVVTEARPSDKRRSIEGNAYLDYCWRTLHECSSPIAVFGHSLSEQDAHLVDALNEHRDRPIAVGIHDKGKRTNRSEQHRIASLLEGQPLYFFDSATHPLGSERLRMQRRPRRRFMRSSKSDKAN